MASSQAGAMDKAELIVSCMRTTTLIVFLSCMIDHVSSGIDVSMARRRLERQAKLQKSARQL